MKQKIQIALILAMLIAGIRLAVIFYERHEEASQPKKQQAAPLDPDYYVTPKKLYLYDLKSARQLTRQPVWVKVGYYYSYFPYDPATHAVNFAHESGKLQPIQKLEIKDVVAVLSKDEPGKKQVMAVFLQAGKSYAVAIGSDTGGDFKFFSDDMFFIEDPHQLYKHWPADVWQAIDQHQAKPGMNELQADFAIGIGLAEPGADAIDKTLNYPNDGKPLRITYHDGKAADIRPGAAG
jgi:hypothetical protein